jgi:hypothetical protein
MGWLRQYDEYGMLHIFRMLLIIFHTHVHVHDVILLCCSLKKKYHVIGEYLK